MMPPRKPRRRTRDPQGTREKLLRAAFQEIYRRGFQAASLETILAQAGITKGALYHHFPDKAALGQAVLDEVVTELLLQRWSVRSLEEVDEDPITALQEILRHRASELTGREVELGCPLNNLAQEMSPVDERFRRRIDATFDIWREAFAGALNRGRNAGTVKPEVDPDRVAAFIVAAIEGSFGLAKTAQSTAMLRSNLEVLSGFLDTLRSTSKARRRAPRIQ
jgi:TetR/AcrR family transcriptional regulator, transcriptional repressor for nem operon